MSEADKMFDELGYELIVNDKFSLNYEKEGMYMDTEIVFYLRDKNILIEYGNGESANIGMQELKAINKKVLELRLD